LGLSDDEPPFSGYRNSPECGLLSGTVLGNTFLRNLQNEVKQWMQMRNVEFVVRQHGTKDPVTSSVGTTTVR
jgi:hypothetical protein